MADKVNIVQTKVAFIKFQAQELHGLLDAFVDKEVTFATAAANSERQDVSTVRLLNSRLDAVLDYLLGKCAEIESVTCGSVVHLQSQQVQSNESMSTNIYGSQDIQELTGRIAALELATSVVNDRTSVLVQTSDEQKIKFNIIEDRLKNLALEFAEKEQMKKCKYESNEKKRKLHDSVVSSHTERLGKIQSQLQNLISSNTDLSKRLDSRFSSVTDIIKQIQNEWADVRSSLNEKEQETLFCKKLTEDLKSDLHKLKSEHNQVENSLADLSSKMSLHEMVMNSSAVSRINEENQITELQEKVHEVEQQRHEDLDYYKTKLAEIDSLYKQVCQMVEAKVTPLRRLQDILYKYQYTKELQEAAALQIDDVDYIHPQTHLVDYNDSQIDNVLDVHSLSGASCVGTRRRRVAVGFTAYWGEHTVITENSVIIFTDVLCNEGGCYSPSTGMFTAPYDGLYLASLTLRQRNEGGINAHIRADKSRVFTESREDTVCKVLTHADKTGGCDIGVVRMKAGDKLLVRVMEAESTPRLSFYSGFSCVLIG